MVTASLGLEGTAGGHLHQPLARAGLASAGCPRPVQFWVLPQLQVPQPVWETYVNVQSRSQWNKSFPMFGLNLLVFILSPLPCSVSRHYWGEPGFLAFILCHQALTLMRSLWDLSSRDPTVPALIRSSCERWLSHGLPEMYCLSKLGWQERGWHNVWPSQRPARRVTSAGLQLFSQALNMAACGKSVCCSQLLCVILEQSIKNGLTASARDRILPESQRGKAISNF